MTPIYTDQSSEQRKRDLCLCGHRRIDHVDSFQVCDHCDCEAFEPAPKGADVPPTPDQETK